MRKLRAIVVTGAAVGAAAVGGAAIANAASTTTPATTTSTSTTAPPSVRPPMNMPAPGTVAHEDAETAVTGATAAKVQAAAVKYVGSGTAGVVTTDYTHTGYEVTVTKADSTKVALHLTSSFAVMQGGGPRGSGRPGAGGGPAAGGYPGGPGTSAP
jgi:hypothetical protein